MKVNLYVLAAFTLFFTGLSYSSESDNGSSVDKERRCITMSYYYSSIAHKRDSGLSPQQTLENMSIDPSNGIDEKFLKKTINLLYFNPSYVNAGGDRLQQQIYLACTGREYKPLK